jgi:hypothetical protein
MCSLTCVGVRRGAEGGGCVCVCVELERVRERQRMRETGVWNEGCGTRGEVQ